MATVYVAQDIQDIQEIHVPIEITKIIILLDNSLVLFALSYIL